MSQAKVLCRGGPWDGKIVVLGRSKSLTIHIGRFVGHYRRHPGGITEVERKRLNSNVRDRAVWVEHMDEMPVIG